MDHDPPLAAILRSLVNAGNASPCIKSKRGVVLVAPDGETFTGYNHPATGTCDGSDACRRDCPRICIHAEQAALLAAGGYAACAEIYHSKIEDGRLVPKWTFNCIECSKLMLAAGVAGVWLFTEEGWRRWTAEEFHRGTLANLGMHGGAPAHRDVPSIAPRPPLQVGDLVRLPYPGSHTYRVRLLYGSRNERAVLGRDTHPDDDVRAEVADLVPA